MTHMFENCESIVSLDLSSFDISNTKSLDGMFKYSYKLTKIYERVDGELKEVSNTREKIN